MGRMYFNHFFIIITITITIVINVQISKGIRLLPGDKGAPKSGSVLA